MNYGRYFRLNRNLSRIEDGFAIYDYIDLPAYFIASKDNLMSPKYPISAMVTSDSVVFRLHYSAYKIEESTALNKKDRDPKYPQYLYESHNQINQKNSKVKSGDVTKIVHMEEVILELPYTDINGRSLSEIIKAIYNTNFPQILRDYDNDTGTSDTSSIKNNSSGGRFLEKIIRKRYLEENVNNTIDKDGQTNKDKDVNDEYYDSLRKLSDGATSYSTLWLMGLVTEVGKNRWYKRTDKEGKIVGFLRKLLLDFMFDLKHSDLFQNSANYQKMYSGLMSDFFFSALMHKCEYYYYRTLTNHAIEDFEKDKAKLTNKEIIGRKDAIATLYANELIKAEELWTQDIMNPLAEKCFDYKFYNATYNNYIVRKLSEYCVYLSSVFFERLTTDSWPSWFAEPEEGMRRVCFPMNENGHKVICNADTLVNYLCLEAHVGDDSKKMVQSRNESQEKISHWFLKRYDFNDLIHLHTFKHINLFLVIAVVYITFLLFTNKKISVSILEDIKWCKDNSISFLCVFGGLLIIQVYLCSKWNKMVFIHIWSKIKKILFVGCVIGVIGYFFYQNEKIDFLFLGSFGSLVLLLCLLGFLAAKYEIPCVRYLSPPSLSPVSYIHLMLPRLVSAITAAWLTISLGFDIYVSFFDSEPSWPTAIAISLIVLGFIMYEINRIMPSSTSVRKLYRSLELLFLSYGISLLVGLVVINFVGEKFLERGGTMDDFYEQYVEFKGYEGLHGFEEYVLPDSSINVKNLRTTEEKLDYIIEITAKRDTMDYYRKRVDSLEYVYHSKKTQSGFVKTKEYPVIEKIPIMNGKYHLFLMRDFLIMFSFIAMFWGIFIQMIFTGEKQMTEL